MAYDSLYSSSELIAKIKALDEQMDLAETKSKLNSGQSEHEFSISIRTLREQREYYLGLLQKVDLESYKNIFGSSVINFRGNSCR